MLKYGFFDSIRGDRKYNSKDVAELFDGIIVDGIYAQIGERFSVNPKKVIETEEDLLTVTVGSGQAWLSHTKIINTSKLELALSESIGANRYDAIIVEVNENTRTANIFVKPNVNTKTDNAATAFDLVDGQLINTEFIHQYLLAVILIQGGADRITQENIASKIGFAIPSGIPYVTCPLEPFPADETLKQWVAQWATFLTNSNTAFNNAQESRATEFTNDQNARAAAFTTDQNTRTADYQALRTSIVNWLNSTQTDWNTWYNSVKDDLDGYFAGKLEAHNTSNSAHEDMRTSINTLFTRLNAIADSDDTTLDQMSEIVAFIKQNRETIGFLTGVAEGAVLNTKDKAGYVAAGGTNKNVFWGTDINGNPSWRQPFRNFPVYREQIMPNSILDLIIDNPNCPGLFLIGNGENSLTDRASDDPNGLYLFFSDDYGVRTTVLYLPYWDGKDIKLRYRLLGFWATEWITYTGTTNGVLPVENGGTGASNGSAAVNKLFSYVPNNWNFYAIDDSYRIPMTAGSGNNVAFAWRTMGTVWEYMKSKIQTKGNDLSLSGIFKIYATFGFLIENQITIPIPYDESVYLLIIASRIRNEYQTFWGVCGYVLTSGGYSPGYNVKYSKIFSLGTEQFALTLGYDFIEIGGITPSDYFNYGAVYKLL